MSDIATRQALNGGDADVWAPFEQAQNHLAIGSHTRYLYLLGGALYLSAGMSGLYDGSQYYNISNAAARSLNIASLTASLWATVELSVVAGNVVTTLTSLLGFNNPAVIPTTFTGAYDPTKGGHYITGTKRCVALLWINAAGQVAGIVNAVGGVNGYSGYSTSDNASLVNYPWFQIDTSFTIPQSATTVWKTANYTIPNQAADITVYCTGGRTVTLPSAVLNAYVSCRVIKSDDNAWWVNIASVAGTLSSREGNGVTQATIRRVNDEITFVSDGSNWYVKSDNRRLYIDSGWIYTTSMTNRQLGTIRITHTGSALVAANIIGMKIAGATSTSYGWITAYDNVNKYIYVRDFVNNSTNVLTSGETLNITNVDAGAVTSTTNEAANWVNKNVPVWHNFGIGMDKYNMYALWSSDKTETNDHQLYPVTLTSDPYGVVPRGVDTNSTLMQSATSGTFIMENNGGRSVLGGSIAGYYKVIADLL